jgi:hypothetical protein
MAIHEVGDELVAQKEELCGFENCKELAVYRCHKCSRLFCVDHASEIDPQHYCTECLTPEECNVIEMPLVDSEGTRHRGRLIRPVGRAFIENGKLINELNDEELKDFIVQYQKLLVDVEKVTNLYRVSLTQATHEALDREILKQKPTGEFYFPPPQRQPPKTTKAREPMNRVVAAMKKANVTPEMIQKILDERKNKKAAS